MSAQSCLTGFACRLLRCSFTAARPFLFVLFVAFLTLPGGRSIQSGNADGQSLPQPLDEFRTVSPGIEHLRINRGHKSEDERTGPWLINVLRIDLKQAELRVNHALDEGVGLETTSSIAARYGAIAAVNAGFFRTSGTYRGESTGALMVDGKLISEPLDGRAAFGLIKSSIGQKIIFGHLKFSGYVKTDRSRRAINGLNRPRGSDEMIVYTPEFHRSTLTTPEGVEAIVRGNTIIRVKQGAGSSLIPSDGFVVSAAGTARDWVLANVRAGSRVRLDLSLEPVETRTQDAWKQASFVVGGGPQLIRAGRVDITSDDEKVEPRFVSDRHPRTAIARLKDERVLMVTVDGRQPGVSVGMALPELAELVLELGALDAINLDGGGSTTMVVNGKLVNVPSDQPGERPVSGAILLLPRGLRRASP